MWHGNTITQRLATRPFLLGFLQTHPNLAVTEMAGICGYDFVLVDAEHGLFGETDCATTFQVLSGRGVASFIRVRDHNASAIGRYLDMGADAIVVPNVSTGDEARALVCAMEYPPKGIRGIGSAAHRVTGYGLDSAEYLADSRGGAALFIIVESAQGVDKADQITSVSGVDGVIIGPADLSAALVGPGRFSRDAYAQAFGRIEQAAKKHGKILGSAPHEGYSVEKLFASGHRLLILGTDTPVIRAALSRMVTDARTVLQACPPGPS